MIKNVFKPKRKVKGRTVVSRLYTGRYQLAGMAAPKTVALRVGDKSVAEKILDDLVREKEKEIAGIALPKIQVDAAKKLLMSHVDDFLADLEVGRRDSEYIYIMEKRLRRLMIECKWIQIRDVTAASLNSWKRSQKGSAGTINQYLESASRFMNWMVANERVAVNPLRGMAKIDERGSQRRKRRAFSDGDLRRVLEVAGKWGVGYLAAVHTGLRRKELEALEWRHVHLDVQTPHLVLGEEFTKNREAAKLPIHPELADELRGIRPNDALPTEKIFSRETLPTIYMVKKHLKLANVPYVDEAGGFADFHALRHTLATNLSRFQISPRTAMEMMRHSDIRLTMNVYTDASQLGLQKVVDVLPSFLPPSSSKLTDGEGKSGAEHCTQIRTQTPDSDGQELAQPVAGGSSGAPAHSFETEGFRRDLTPSGADCRDNEMAALLGLEPRQTDPESVVLPLHHKAVGDSPFSAGRNT